MNIYEKLAVIQQEIKVPKGQNNTFAGFKYRSAEDIMEKLKPLLAKHKAVAWLTDEVVERAGQVYIQAWAHICNIEDSGEEFAVSASAREEKTRPKMSEGQLTGAASSYARKYALNGLLLLDDNKDPDSQNNSQKAPKNATAPSTLLSKEQLNELLGYAGHRVSAGQDGYQWLWDLLTIDPAKIPAFKFPDALDLVRKQPIK